MPRYGMSWNRRIMNNSMLKNCCAIGLATLVSPAMASLGGNDTSVHSDGDHLHAQIQNTQTVDYDVDVLTADSGLVIREYLTRSGTVFAVTWQGPVLPDLPQLLAGYFARYDDALKQRPQAGTQAQVHVAQQELVVQSAGHMRAFSGRAYLPQLVPAGVDADALP
jgi:hypothetical protein